MGAVSCGDVRPTGHAVRRGMPAMNPREYIETLALELSRAGGRGLVLSPADAQLALAWHAAEVPLQTVVHLLRRAASPRGTAVRGAVDPGLSLQAIERSVTVRAGKRPRKPPEPRGLTAQLKSAA